MKTTTINTNAFLIHKYTIGGQINFLLLFFKKAKVKQIHESWC